jgi:hypothetical protein
MLFCEQSMMLMFVQGMERGPPTCGNTAPPRPVLARYANVTPTPLHRFFFLFLLLLQPHRDPDKFYGSWQGLCPS